MDLTEFARNIGASHICVLLTVAISRLELCGCTAIATTVSSFKCVVSRWNGVNIRLNGKFGLNLESCDPSTLMVNNILLRGWFAKFLKI